MTAATHPYHPIIYVRGFAATQGEIEETVADPYMGFNIGSAKARTAWTGELRRYYFESPLVRLMGDHQYEDVFVEGEDMVSVERPGCLVPYRSIVIYRYYDDASKDFGSGDTPPVEHFARGLGHLILQLRNRVCQNPANQVTPDGFRCYLVAHSMGGLVCRAFLQNGKLGDPAARAAVDKLFTYATPHNGIDMRIVRNVPGWLSFGDANNFNRERMAGYLGLPKKSADVSVVNGFPPERIFNLVGTNPRDYTVAGGLSAWAATDASDGLVRIANATTRGPGHAAQAVASPRAYVHRSHSGHYGIVNSEEGYQNLTRFLFGRLRVDGILEVDAISLPPDVQQHKDAGRRIKASYQFEVAVSVRGAQWQITRREVRENSAIFRTYDELLPQDAAGHRVPDRSCSPRLFSVFLDPWKSVHATPTMPGPVSFAVDIKVLVPDYRVDDLLFLKRHYEGGHIVRQLVLVEAFPDDNAPGGWSIKYGFQDASPGKADTPVTAQVVAGDGGLTFAVPIVQSTRPGFRGALRFLAQNWNS